MARYATTIRQRVDMRLDIEDINFLDSMAAQSTYNRFRTSALEEVLGLVRIMARYDWDLGKLEPLSFERASVMRTMEKIKKAAGYGKTV